MNRKLFVPVVLLAVALSFPVFAGGRQEEPTASGQAPAAEEQQAEPITLELYHWFGPEVKDALDSINEQFHQEYPNVTVNYESAPTDQYRNVIKVKLASGDAPDVFGVFPGTEVADYAAAGHLMDLTDEPFMDRIMEGSTRVTRGNDGRIYSLPVDQNVIAVVYNRAIFEEVGVDVPETWEDFIAVAEEIKAAGYYPLALGAADLWVTQLIPYAMAPGMIYKDNPDFDQMMYDGDVKFDGPEWRAVMDRYLELLERDLFHPGILSTTYDQTIQLMATEQAAMVVQGNWVVAGIRTANPDLEIGMFPLPVQDPDEQLWISAAVGITIGAYADGDNQEAAKNYLEFWTRPEIIAQYLNAKKAFSTVNGVEVDFDPAAAEIGTYLSQANSYPFLDQNWPAGVQDVFLRGYQALFAGDMSVREVLQSVDEEWAARTAE